MSLVFGILLLQATPVLGTVPDRTPELDTANACLTEHAQNWVERRRRAPEKRERWEWAQKIAAQCKTELDAAANGGGAVASTNTASQTISPRDALQSEALYYIDSIIRKHYEQAE